MLNTTQTCAGSPWPDSSVMTHGEYESGFLLPQLMGALATEYGRYGFKDFPEQPSNGPLIVRLGASLKQLLKLRQPA